MGWRLSVSGLVRLVAAATCGTLLVVGCSASPAVDPAGGGDQGSFTMLPPAQRQAAPLITGDTLDGRAWRSDAVKDKVLRDTVKKEDGDGSCCDDDREGDCKGALEHMATDFRVVPEECDVVASLLVEIEARAG